MKSPSTKQEAFTAESHLLGTKTKGFSTYQCQAMSTNNSSNIIIRHPKNLSTHHMRTNANPSFSSKGKHPIQSADPMAPKTLRSQHYIHQQHTRNNTPMPTIFEESRQGLQRIRRHDHHRQTTPTIQQPRPQKSIKQHHSEQITQQATTPPKPTQKGIYITQDDDNETSMLEANCLILQSTTTPCNIKHHAHYHVMGNHLNNAFCHSFTSTKFNKQHAVFESEIQLDHTCNGVVHPVTQETITKYETLANDPLLKDVWTQAMCKELGCLVQGWGTNKGTDTVFFMTPEEIKRIPRDQTVTYACIVVDYRLQKDDPNCVHITVGGNLIDYPGELTT